MTKKELIYKCGKRDRKAQQELFMKHREALYHICLKYCRNYAEAEDTLHDVFIIIFNKIKTYKGTGSFEGWMKRIAIFTAIDVYKSKKEFSVAINEEYLTKETETSNFSIDLDNILEAVQQLPDQYRLVFNLFQLDGYSHKEIARMLSISEGTSKSNYHRAKLILREKLSNDTLKNKGYGAT